MGEWITHVHPFFSFLFIFFTSCKSDKQWNLGVFLIGLGFFGLQFFVLIMNIDKYSLRTGITRASLEELLLLQAELKMVTFLFKLVKYVSLRILPFFYFFICISISSIFIKGPYMRLWDSHCAIHITQQTATQIDPHQRARHSLCATYVDIM